jgi:hypothetical protein
MAQDGWNEIERWHEIKDKLDAVLKLAPEQRPAYLDQVSTADPELRRELESLIASHEQAGTDFLNVPPPQAAADPSAPNNLKSRPSRTDDRPASRDLRDRGANRRRR